jgi:hypothetical protein
MPVKSNGSNKVRIAVAINEFGQWAAYGRWDVREDEAMEEANGNVGQDGPQACYFVEVEVPVPHRQILEGHLAQDGAKVVEYKAPPKEDKK